MPQVKALPDRPPQQWPAFVLAFEAGSSLFGAARPPQPALGGSV